MNGKAYVSKELNAKHRKILEGLLKLPENRECADCETRAPRWASVNLGIFICMQCSGIHRSLGVHISKVRSATLDTWLPEQVAFIQSMGNEKSNSYWEAELPPNYNRVRIENFIRAKYQEKRWVPRDGKAKSPSGLSEEKASVHRPGSRSGHQYANNINHVSEERKIAQPPITNNGISAPKHSTPATVKVVKQVKPDPKPQEPVQNSKTSVPKTEPAKQEAGITPVASRPKVTTLVAAHPQVTTPAVAKPKLDYATELFNLLSMDDSRGNDSKMSVNEKPWTSFQSSEEKTTAEIYISSNSTESKVLTKYGIEDLINDPPSVTPSIPEKPQKDEKNDIGNLFEKPKMVSPFSVQPQHALLSQQQSSLMANSAKSSSASQTFPFNVHQPGSNGIQFPNQSRGIAGHQVPGMMMMPVAGQQNYVQMGIDQYAKPTSSSMYTQGTIVAINGTANIRTSRPPSVNPSQLGIKDYDFSSLTQGMFTKR